MRRLAIPLTMFALLAAACSAGEPTTAPIVAPTAPAAPAPVAPAPDRPAPAVPVADAPPTDPGTPDDTPSVDDPAHPFTADTRPDTNPGSGPLVTLTDVRTGRHEGYDRVVLDLEGGGQAGWRVEYVDQALADGSGDPVTVAGDQVLQVLLGHTGLPDDTGVALYDGPRRIAGPGVVAEIAVIGMFEGTTQLFLGIDGHRPFRVFAVGSRVVIDVAAA